MTKFRLFCPAITSRNQEEFGVRAYTELYCIRSRKDESSLILNTDVADAVVALLLTNFLQFDGHPSCLLEGERNLIASDDDDCVQFSHDTLE